MTQTCEKPSRGRYVHGCRCEACTAANRAYERSRRLYGYKSSFVDAQPVRNHVAKLLASGYTRSEICRVSGISRTTLRAILDSHHRTGKPVGKVNASAAEKILSVNGKRRLRGKQLVDARYVRKGIEKCLSAGMSVAAISRATGIDRQTLDAVIHLRRQRITSATLYAWIIAEPALARKRNQADLG